MGKLEEDFGSAAKEKEKQKAKYEEMADAIIGRSRD